ncbi:MAG: alpha-galactosidase [Verrucomicrobia bacterium]|nr:alpha-galactosidase [Verrucomicrobiota bacterium]
MNSTKPRIVIAGWTFTDLNMKFFRDQETNGSVRGLKRLGTLQAALVFLSALAAVSAHAAVTVAPAEMALKTDWVQKNLLTPAKAPPFSFTFDGRSSAALLRSWKRVDARRTLDANRTERVITWTDAASGLVVKCVAVEYSDYPVVEWTVFLKNSGTSNTPILQDIKGLNTSFHRANGPEFVLNGNKGDFTTEDSYEPYRVTLRPNTVKTCAPFYYSGKSSDGPEGWPYYNLQIPGGGVILAIGWPGQWESSFTRDATDGLNLQAGQQLTHLFLQPGETIRTPLIALLFWQGTNTVRAQNLWRRWYIAHNIPRINGQPPAPISQIQVSGDDTSQVEGFFKEGVKPDVCWRDAGAGGPHTWYPCSTGLFSGDNNIWLNTGDWEVDPAKYPAGFKPYSDWIHARGLKFLLWFEPERIGNTNSWLSKNHPEWILPRTRWTVGYILNEGHPGAFHWLTNHFDALIKANGIDWYREDMNGDGPLTAWRTNDTANRQGITENFYVQNHLAYWDALKAMNPGLRIDSCASGGRRNDLETMRRAVPLTRSDFEFVYMPNVVDGNQCQTYGASSWLPFQGTGAYLYDPYSFRSFYMASFGMGGLSPETTAAQKQAYNECKKLGPAIIHGDYYPLTPYSRSNNVWMAWQFDRPDLGEGHAQIFRRTNSPIATMSFPLQGLEPEQTYEVEDFDKAEKSSVSGKDLMKTGLTVTLGPRGSAIFQYKLIKPAAKK